jgi:hypothetical protein
MQATMDLNPLEAEANIPTGVEDLGERQDNLGNTQATKGGNSKTRENLKENRRLKPTNVIVFLDSGCLLIRRIY